MSTPAFATRPAAPTDIPAINAIHKHYVENTVITFITEPNSDDTTLANFEKVKAEGLPYLVAAEVKNDNNVLGYIYVSSFRGVKPGYRHTLELSLFVHPDHVRRGIGRRLLESMLIVLRNPTEYANKGCFAGTRLLDSKPRQLMAVMAIDVDMPGQGLKLRDWYLQFGFEQRAHLREVGWKKERWIDTLYLQLAL